MNKRLFIRRGFILVVLLIFFIYLIWNYSAIEKWANDFLKSQIETWGYLGVVLSVFVLEFFPQPLLSALVPFTIGLVFNLKTVYLLILLVSISVIANYSAYFVGKYYADTIALYLISKKNYDLSVKWFEKYGMKVMTILALTPLPYFPIMGGIFKMTFKEFTIYAIIPRIFHLLIFSFLILWML